MKKVRRVDSLTSAHRARMAEWRDRWIEIGLSTAPADRTRFERAIPVCYRAAGLEPPKRIVWVSSPLVGALAFPAAAMILALREKKEIRGAVGGAVRDAVDVAVGGAVRGAVDVAVGGAVGGAVRGAVGGAVGDAVRGAVRDAVDVAVRDAVGDAVRGAVRDAVGDAVRGAVDVAVGDAQISTVYFEALSKMWAAFVGGQLWVGGWYWGSPSYVSFFREVCGLELSEDIAARAQAYEDTASSACWWWPHKDFVMVCERPRVIARDAQGRLHREDGPAAEWGDGWGVYRIHGIAVPADIIEHPERLTVDRIHAEKNEEVRRVMVERYGLARYVRDAQFDVIDQDVDPVGQPRRLLRRGQLTVIELHNSTVDADGSRRIYHVPVHPELRPLLPDGDLGEPQKATALNAVASTYGLRGDQYQLETET